MKENTVLSVPGTIGVLANDFDPDPNTRLVITRSGSPMHGRVVFNRFDGSFRYQPVQFFNGVDSFTYTISDGVLFSSATVQINVQAVNNAPLVSGIVPSSSTDAVGATRSFSLSVFDGDGVDDLKQLSFYAAPSFGASGVVLDFLPQSNQLFLRGNPTPITPGTGTLSNNAVSLDGASVSVERASDGKSLTLNFALTAKAGIIGLNSLFGFAQDKANAVDPAGAAMRGFVLKGRWRVVAPANAPSGAGS